MLMQMHGKKGLNGDGRLLRWFLVPLLPKPQLWTEFSSLGHEHSLQAHYASFRCVRENRVEPGATQQLDRTASISPSHVFVMSALTLRTRRHPTEAVWKRNRNECEQVDFRRMR